MGEVACDAERGARRRGQVPPPRSDSGAGEVDRTDEKSVRDGGGATQREIAALQVPHRAEDFEAGLTGEPDAPQVWRPRGGTGRRDGLKSLPPARVYWRLTLAGVAKW